MGPDTGREVRLAACLVREIQHPVQVSLANYGSLFVCACVGAYVPVLKIACLVCISSILGFTSFTFSS